MTINRYNYEVFLVDYLDGNLNPSLASELMMFLDQNPDLKEEFDGLGDAVLVAENISYPGKSDLKKKSFLKDGIDNEQDYRYIAAIEGVLSVDEQLKLEKELSQNPVKRKVFDIYKKTVIQPAPFIEYPDKLQLKRSRVIPIRYVTLRRTISVAASIAIILGIYTISRLIVGQKEISIGTNNRILAIEKPQANTKSKQISVENKTVTKAITQEKNEIAFVKVEPVNADTLPNKVIPQQAEQILTQIASIESRNIIIGKNYQYEQVGILLEEYSLRSDFAVKYGNSVAENTPIKSGYREIGLFEILQYGVQKFGNLIGKDLKLTAKKDKTGRIEEIRFESNLIAFSKPIRKKE